jgi:hypothetical protein
MKYFKYRWRDFWYEWVQTGQPVVGLFAPKNGYYRFRKQRLYNLVGIIGLILILILR